MEDKKNMNISQCEDILGSFDSDSTDLPETSRVRAKEWQDSHVFYFRDWLNIMTTRGLERSRFYRICENSFSRKRNRFDEPGQVALHPYRFRTWDRLKSIYEIALHKETDPQKIKRLEDCLKHTKKVIKKIKTQQQNNGLSR